MVKIRQVCKKDNLNLSNVIREVLTEIGVPKKGTAYSVPELDFKSAGVTFPSGKPPSARPATVFAVPLIVIAIS